MDGFESAGVVIRNLVAVGGIPRKSEYIMQMLSDVLDKKITVLDSEQTGALGAAIYAAVASGIYPNTETACEKMSPKGIREYIPNKEKRALYDLHYEEYIRLCELAEKR